MSEVSGNSPDLWRNYLHSVGVPGEWPEGVANSIGPRVFGHMAFANTAADHDGRVSEAYAAQITNEGNQINRTVPVDLTNEKSVRDGTNLAHEAAIACDAGEQLLSSYTKQNAAAHNDVSFHIIMSEGEIQSKPVRTIAKLMRSCRTQRAAGTARILSEVEALLDERREDTINQTLPVETAAEEDKPLLSLLPNTVVPQGNWRDETGYVGFETDEPVEDVAMARQMASYANELELAQRVLGVQLQKAHWMVRAAEHARGPMEDNYSFTSRLGSQVLRAISDLAGQEAFALESALDVVSAEITKRYEIAQFDYACGQDNTTFYQHADQHLGSLVQPGEYGEATA